jgi:peptidoglycan hydrolase CwlO-like protein
MHPKDVQSILDFAIETQKALQRLCAKIDEHTDEIKALKEKVDALEKAQVGRLSQSYSITVAR